MASNRNPVLVNVNRNGVVESCHRGSVIVVDDKGNTVFSLGDVERNIYPRSSIKFFQAIPLIESGAADHFKLSDKEIALACSSHSAELFHVNAITAWLEKIGLDTNHLENGPALPFSDEAKYELFRNGLKPGRIHQNCSGKHTGMLSLAQYLGGKTRGYSEHSHATQQAWMAVLSDLVDIDVKALKWERDGCGLPAICMPMARLAYGCALFANPVNLAEKRKQAMNRILEAVKMHPLMISGTNECSTDVIEKSNGRFIVKPGAEGVYSGIIPEQGLGLAIKIDDGSSRGSEVALGAVLKKLNVLDNDLEKKLSPYFSPKILNSQNWQTGEVRPSEIWD